MKQIKLFTVVFFVLGTMVIACKKNEFSSISEEDKQELHEKTGTVLNGNDEPTNAIDPLEIQNLEQLIGFDISSTIKPSTELEAASSLTSLVNNSSIYFDDLGVPHADLSVELNDYEVAYAAIILEAMNTQGNISICNNGNIWVKCLINMALPCSILEGNPLDDFRQNALEYGVREGFKRLSYSAKKTIIVAIGKRAVATFGGGALSLAFFVYDYANCIVNGDLEVTTPQVNLIPIALGGIIDTYLLPISSSANISYYLDFPNDGVLTNMFVYFNSEDEKYYTDSAFTVLVPNGYYRSPALTPFPLYYHIVNGVSIMAYQLNY